MLPKRLVAFIASNNELDPVEVRVTDVTSNGFDIFMQEAGGDLIHGSETVNYIVIEAGLHTLDGGLEIEARTLESSGEASAGDAVTFEKTFANPPVVLYSLNSNNSGDFGQSRPTMSAPMVLTSPGKRPKQAKRLFLKPSAGSLSAPAPAQPPASIT